MARRRHIECGMDGEVHAVCQTCGGLKQRHFDTYREARMAYPELPSNRGFTTKLQGYEDCECDSR